MRIKIKFFVLLSVILLSRSTYACEEPMPGMLWSISQLLENSSEVYLAQLKTEKDAMIFEVLETLQGEKKKLIKYNWSNQAYINGYDSSSFHHHTDSTFWKDWIGRSQFECCECSPRHTFRVGDIYLLFPEFYGARKHAERIVSLEKDQWLSYVRAYYLKRNK